MILMRKGIKEFVIDSTVTEEVFDRDFAEYCRRCNEPRVKKAKVKALFKAVQNIKNQFAIKGHLLVHS